MTKRWRTPKAKPGELKVAYGKEYGDLDLYYCWQDIEGGKRDTKVLMHFFEHATLPEGNTLRKELEARGYDITTLKFSIMKKQEQSNG